MNSPERLEMIEREEAMKQGAILYTEYTNELGATTGILKEWREDMGDGEYDECEEYIPSGDEEFEEALAEAHAVRNATSGEQAE